MCYLLYVGHGVDALEVQDRVRRQLHPDPNSNTSTDVFVSPQHSSHLFGGSGAAAAVMVVSLTVVVVVVVVVVVMAALVGWL